ncbi:MAG: L-aspartate oxidase, partial [Desulfobacterales bacterium CG23_combo_of_CG06-09_8_20_14_all_51_8]
MEYESDFLVIGSGVAGLLFALKVADHGTVIIITKRNIAESNTAYAQGGIATVFAKTDSFAAHINDTHASGDGLCNEQVVDMVVKSAPERIQELIRLGVKFNRNQDAAGQPSDLHLDLCREGGHSHNRIVHADDLTGLAVEKALVAQVMAHKNIRVFENHIAIDLITRSTRLQRGMVITTHEDYCYGAYVMDRNTTDIHTFCGRTIMLATGGAGKVYAYTSNPDIATGDGIAMAYRTGATVANLEFVQFHPTCLYHPAAKNFLISEAVRGDGGILINAAGERFMEHYSPLKELACRDVVARAIDAELKKRGDDSVFLDISHKDPEFVRTRFPNLYAKCLSFGINMTEQPIPVVPAAHYMCGGVATDMFGRTNIQRLFAIGETACTGLHGANRLASNSLLEALVYAHNAAEQSIDDAENFSFEASPQLP